MKQSQFPLAVCSSTGLLKRWTHVSGDGFYTAVGKSWKYAGGAAKTVSHGKSRRPCIILCMQIRSPRILPSLIALVPIFLTLRKMAILHFEIGRSCVFMGGVLKRLQYSHYQFGLTFGALKLDRLGLSCKASKCSDAGTGDLGVLTTHETSPCFSLGDDGSTRPGWMPTQVQVSLI